MLADRAFLRRLTTLFLPLALIASGLFSAVAVQAGATPVGSKIDQVLNYVAPTTAPFDGQPISHGLGPTYGEAWCADAAPGSSIANQQGSSGPGAATLALIPYEAFPCLLDQFQAEAAAAGVPPRMSYSLLGQTDAGRNQYGVVVNAMETPEQVSAYNNWVAYRAIALTDPINAKALLASFGDNVKIPVFIENNIHGDEEEGADSMMQVIRDLVTTPRGVHPTVDNFLDHAILITIPNMNPDGRFNGTRANGNGYDMNRDLLVQSQPEVRNNIKLQIQWLAPVMLATHGYVNPTLIDGLTKPHNPGLEYDFFVYWNQRRLDANQAALARIGQNITRPVNGPLPNPVNGFLSRGFCMNGGSPASNICATFPIAAAPTGLTQSGTTVTVTYTPTANNVIKVADTVIISGAGEPGYNGGPFRVNSIISPTQFTYEATTSGLAPSGGGTVGLQTGPNQAEGWDDLGPFYTQTYGAFFGVDGSTLEMCSACTAPWTGRLGSKTVQYVGFWSSADYWIENRAGMLADQVEMFVRGANDADRPNCCVDPLVAARGFTETEHNWMIPYPKAYIIPTQGGGQRSDAEANRMAQWLLDNGITVQRMTADFTWGSTTYPAGSYVVPMNQPMRGLALTTLSAGQDFSVRISQLYAPPGAWSHGLMWGADTVEVPRGDASFSPATEVITAVNPLTGGVAAGPSDWYSVTIRGVREGQAIYDLLRDGIYGQIAETPFTSTSGGPMPAGSIIFPNDPTTIAALQAAGAAAGIVFERNVAVPKPPTTRLLEPPKVAILANANAAGVFANTDVRTSLKVIFGPDADFVSLLGGPNSVQTAAVDPLLAYDVIYNTGQAYPAVANATARERLNAFFARGGGYITPNVNNSLNFLTASVPVLVTGPFTQTNASAGGGTAIWSNVGGSSSPLTGAFPATDYWFLPSNVTYFNAIPADAVVDGRYLPDMVNANVNGPSAGFVAGLWRNRTSAASVGTNNAPVLLHGNTSAASRYTAIATNPFSRSDFERIWGWIVQSALWTNLTDDHLDALSDAHIWLGLRGSDDQGTRFDVKVELYRNAETSPLASGLTRCVTGLTRNANAAKDVVVPWGEISPVSLAPGDTLSIKVSTRIGTNPDDTKCTIGPGGAHNNATALRLYYDASNRLSRFDATFGLTNRNLYLASDGGGCDKPSATRESQGVTNRQLYTNAPSGTLVKCKDSGKLNFNGGNPYTEVSTWKFQ